MAKGIRLPVRVGPRGGMEVMEGPEIIRQNIMLGVRPASSLNPWNQQLTPREETIFDINDNVSGTMFESHVYDLFDDLERVGLATIRRGRGNGILIDATDREREQGNLTAVIRYTDLEEMKSREIRFGGRK